MEIRELSLIKNAFFIVCVFTFGCSQPKDQKVDLSLIPNDTIVLNNAKLKLQNVVYYQGSKPYSGFIKEEYATGTLKSIGSYFQGKQHGLTKTFFPNAKLETERNYKDGIGYGRHFGYWQNGNKKFDFIYINDKREGIQKQWYESGSQYYALSFTNDQENGMQKAWRENGKPFINYEVKDGVRYGLQKSALCYTLKNQKMK
jgi:antitoxin component YwqK of YwqJK toxin-antitoxin module